MGQRTAKQAAAAEADPLPPDLAVMRRTARRLLDPDALVPPADDLETLILTLRGHMQLMLPEVEAAAARVGQDEVMYWCARACVGEAQRKLTMHPGAYQGAAAAYAGKLARSLNALCDHYMNLASPDGRPDLVAYRSLLEHTAACTACMAMDDAGRNMGHSCEAGDRLSAEYREARRALPSPH